MRFLAWGIHLLACAAIALAAMALIDLRGAPPLVRELASSEDAVVLTVMTPRGLVVVRRQSAWLVRPSLEAQLLGWPDTVPGIAEVRSADFAHDKLALVVKRLDGKAALLGIDADRVTQTPMHEAYEPVAVHRGQVHFVAVGEGVTALCEASWNETRVTARDYCRRLEAVSPKQLRGIVFRDEGELIAFGEGDALGFVDEDEAPEEAPATIYGAAFLPPRGTPNLYLDDSARGSLQLLSREVAVVRDGARVMLDRGGKMEPIGTSRAKSGEFVAHRRRPDGWLVVSQRADEALLLDDRLVRLDEGRAPLALTGMSFDGWRSLLAMIALVLAAAPIAWWRARRRLSGLDGANSLYGTLKLSDSLDGDGKLALPKGSALVVKGIEYELSSGIVQLERGVPLIDGDSVCVVGALERGGEGGGPWREGGPRRIVPDGSGRYFVARGESGAWAARLLRRIDGRFLGATVALLAMALVAERLLSRIV